MSQSRLRLPTPMPCSMQTTRLPLPRCVCLGSRTGAGKLAAVQHLLKNSADEHPAAPVLADLRTECRCAAPCTAW